MINWFKKTLGEENVFVSDDYRAAYSTDASNIYGTARLVVFPRSVNEIHTIILFAKRAKIALTVRGGGTSFTGGVVPADSVILDMSKMNKIIKIDEQRGYAIVEPGIIINKLNSKLNETFFPITLASGDAATVGGVIATNAYSLIAHKFGTVQENIITLEVIDGTGKLYKIEDSFQFFCGRECASGIITKAKLKLAPKINTKTELFNFDYIEEALSKFDDLKDGNIIAAEIFDPYCGGYLDSGGYTLAVQFSSERNEENDIWKLRNKLSVLLTAENRFTVMIKVPLQRILMFLSSLKKEKMPYFGSVATGVFFIHPKRELKELEKLIKLVEANKGRIEVGGLGTLKNQFVNREYLEKMEILKNKYDPYRIFNNPARLLK